MPSIIETIERGTDNFKILDIKKLEIKIGLIILSRATELEMISRARAWCEKQDPIITDPDLVKIQEDAFILWKSLVDPNEHYKEITGGRVPNLLFENIEQMEQKLTGDWQDWLGEELIKFKEDVSPFTNSSGRKLEKILNDIKKTTETTEGFLEVFKTVYCSSNGLLPTERKVKDMSNDQWWLIFYSLPEDSQGRYLKSPLFERIKN